MGQLNGDMINKAASKLFSSLDNADDQLVRNLLVRQKCETTVSDGGTAGTAQTETPFWTNHTTGPVAVLAARVITPVAVALNAGNFVTFTVTRRDAAGGNALVVATLTTAATTINAFTPTLLPLTAGNIVVPAGGCLTVLASKAGTGVAISAATSQCIVEVLYEGTAA